MSEHKATGHHIFPFILRETDFPSVIPTGSQLVVQASDGHAGTPHADSETILAETILACKSPITSPIYALLRSARWAGKLFRRNFEV